MICDSAPSLMTLSFHRETRVDNGTPQTYHEAHCGKCKDKLEVAQPIKQDVIMFSRRRCPNPDEFKLVLEVKQVTLGCTCVKLRHRK